MFEVMDDRFTLIFKIFILSFLYLLTCVYILLHGIHDPTIHLSGAIPFPLAGLLPPSCLPILQEKKSEQRKRKT
jgi:hypothetical protein